MNCSSYDLKGCFLGEASSEERLAVEQHVAGCAACREEYDRLRLTQAALLSVRDEEIPARIAFVSDKVFEPRWYQRLWQSGPRLGFVSAAMLACAILVHAFYAPVAPAPAPVAAISQPDIDARVAREVSARLDAAIAQAVARVEERQDQVIAERVAAVENRLKLENDANLAAFQESFKVLKKQYDAGVSQLARANFGGGQ